MKVIIHADNSWEYVTDGLTHVIPQDAFVLTEKTTMEEMKANVPPHILSEILTYVFSNPNTGNRNN